MPRKDRINLLIDHEALDRARRYTARHGTSISRIVTEFLAGLPLEEERELAGLSPTVRRLIGAGSGTDVADWKEYLNEKYGS
jgi:hypothetical protein